VARQGAFIYAFSFTSIDPVLFVMKTGEHPKPYLLVAFAVLVRPCAPMFTVWLACVRVSRVVCRSCFPVFFVSSWSVTGNPSLCLCVVICC
jgi:hypothetical protein